MKLLLRRRARTPIVGSLMFLALLVSSCGGDSDPARPDASPPNSASESDSTQQDDAADSTSASLHASLADFPLPPGSEIPYPADEYDDERGTVVQFVSVGLPHLDVAEYLFAELPTAGYTVVGDKPGGATSIDGIDPEFGGVILFENPDGVPGQVTLNVQGEKTGLNFNVFTAEAR